MNTSASVSKLDISMPSPATSFTRLLDLPPELRTMIYTSYFSLHAGEMYINSPPGPVPPPKPERAGPVNLLLTNHLIHDEALASYLQTTTFCLESPLDLSYFFHRYIYHRHHVRRIILSAFWLVGPPEMAVMLPVAAALPNLRSLCIYIQPGMERLAECLADLVSHYFIGHSIKPANIFVLDKHAEDDFARHLQLDGPLQECDRSNCWLVHEKLKKRFRMEFDRLTDQVRGELCARRGDKKCFWPMRVWREKRTIDVLLGLEQVEEGRIRGVVREL